MWLAHTSVMERLLASPGEALRLLLLGAGAAAAAG